MLVLSRHEDESIVIPTDAVTVDVKVTDLRSGFVTVEITASAPITAEMAEPDTEYCADTDVLFTVVDIRVDKLRFGIEAASKINVHRREVHEAILRQDQKQEPPLTYRPSPSRFRMQRDEWLKISLAPAQAAFRQQESTIPPSAPAA